MNFLQSLFGRPTYYTVIFQPDASGKVLAGFGSGPLICSAAATDTLRDVLDRLNVYRGPDQQLRTVWLPSGNVADTFHHIKTNCTFIIKAESI
jgi:hypothetical protein